MLAHEFSHPTPCQACVIRRYVPCTDPCPRIKKMLWSTVRTNPPLNPDLHYSVLHRKYDELMNLLEFGIDANSLNDDKQTALHIATIRSDLQAARMLLDYGADPNIRTYRGKSPLFYAIYRECLDLITDYVEAGGNLSGVVHGLHNSVLHYFYNAVNIKVIQLLIHYGAELNYQDEFVTSLLHVTVRRNHPSLLRLFLCHGMDVDTLDKQGYTPLVLALMKRLRRDEIYKILLNKGANTNIRLADNLRSTPLRLYLHQPNDINFKVLKLLLVNGADIHAIDRKGQTPLHYALRTKKDVRQAIRLLMDYGASVHAKDHNGVTPFQIALRYNTHHNLRAIFLCDPYLACNPESFFDPLSNIGPKEVLLKYIRQFIVELYGDEVKEEKLCEFFGRSNVMPHLDNCRRELELMKVTKLDVFNDMTVFNYMNMTCRDLAIVARFHDKIEVLPSSILDKFPYYRWKLVRLYHLGKGRKLVSDAAEALNVIFRYALTVYTLDNLVHRLSFGDMRNVIKAVDFES